MCSGTTRRAIPAAGRDSLDELGGFLDPAGLQHGAGREEHQPGRTGLERAGGKRGALREDPSKADENGSLQRPPRAR